MRSIVVTLSVAALAVSMLGGSAEAKARAKGVVHATHSGTFVSAAGGKLVMTGHNGKDHSHALAKDATFTIDGKPGTLAAFKKGMSVSVTTDKSGNVTALSTVPAKPATPATNPAAVTKPAAPAVKSTSTKPASTIPPAAPTKSAAK